MDLRQSRALAGRALGDAGDEIADVFLARALAARCPAQAVLSEESPDDRSRLGQRAVWIVDPLDGTREYREGREDFAVHVALSVDGEARAGAVALPALGATYSTWQPPRPLPPLRGRRLLVVSRSRPPRFADRLAALLGAELRGMGSMGAKAMAVVRGDAAAYVHAGSHHEWDAAAPAAVASHFGLHVSHLDGRPLRFNQADTVQRDLLVCRPELVSEILAALLRVALPAEPT
jgi:3'(2'), 5'-bisphosphate nucleotidase